MASDCSNYADVYGYKTFRCYQKYRCGLLPAFLKSFSFSARVSVAGKSFPRPWTSVSDLSLYSHTLHQPPDFVYTALLPGIPQIEIDLAIATNTARFQPELPDMPRQLQVSMIPS